MYFKNQTRINTTVKGLDNELFQRHVIIILEAKLLHCAEVVTHFITSDYCFILKFYIVLKL